MLQRRKTERHSERLVTGRCGVLEIVGELQNVELR